MQCLFGPKNSNKKIYSATKWVSVAEYQNDDNVSKQKSEREGDKMNFKGR